MDEGLPGLIPPLLVIAGTADALLQLTSYKLQATGFRLQVTGSRYQLQVAGTADALLQSDVEAKRLQAIVGPEKCRVRLVEGAGHAGTLNQRILPCTL